MENERTILIESGFTAYIYRQTKTGVIDFDSKLSIIKAEKLKKGTRIDIPCSDCHHIRECYRGGNAFHPASA
jgi:hypothetical protein